MLEKIAKNVWSVPHPLAVFGVLHLNTRMTIIRLSDGSIWLHSPVPCTDELCKEIDALGRIKYIVAPSCLHHLFIGKWMIRYPYAATFVARGLQRKRTDIAFTQSLSNNLQNPWKDEIDFLCLQGIPATNECVFFHRASQTLVVTDLLFYLPEATGLTKLYARLWFNDFYAHPRIPALVKAAVKDKKAFALCLETIKGWDIQNLALCHHTIPTENVREQVHKALDEYSS